MDALAPLGRLLFSAIFILSGLNHFTQYAAMVGYAGSAGLPLPGVAIAASGLVLVVAGACILLGLYTRVASAALAAFLLLSAVTVHSFWRFPDPQEAQQQLVHFLKNVSMAGGALLLTYFGPGPYSLRRRRHRPVGGQPTAPRARPLRPRPQE